ESMRGVLNDTNRTWKCWQIKDARQNVIEDEFQKIKKERYKFDNDILKKGLDIINSTEPEGNIKRIKVFIEGQCLTFTNKEYTSCQLEKTLESLKKSEGIDIEGTVKVLSIGKESVLGYEVSYDTGYDNIFRKSKQEE